MEYKNIVYDEYADKYSMFRNASPIVVTHICENIGDNATNRILEIGSGTADHLFALTKRLDIHKAYGFDKSEGMIREGEIKNPGLQLTVADALSSFPYCNDYFDFAYSVNVIHYISDLNHYFEEAYRILKHGGLILTVTASTEEMKKYLLKYFSEFGKDETKTTEKLDNIKHAMNESGFKDIHVSSTNHLYKMTVTDVDAIENKATGWSRLLSQECFEKGIKHMKEALKNSICESSEYFLYFWGTK